MQIRRDYVTQLTSHAYQACMYSELVCNHEYFMVNPQGWKAGKV